MNDFPLDFFNSNGQQPSKPPEDHLKELLDDPNKLVELQRKIEEEPHRANELTKEVLGYGSEAVRERMLAKRKKQPYYRLNYANMIKKVLDVMIVDRKDRIFHMRDYRGMSEQTLFSMIGQGLCYLEDHMDKDNVYKEFSSQFTIRRSFIKTSDGWIKICLSDNNTVDLIPHIDTESSSYIDVERTLYNFIDDAPIPSKRYLPVDESCPDLSIKPFNLNDAEIAKLKEIVDKTLPGVLIASINSTRIILVKKEPATAK